MAIKPTGVLRLVEGDDDNEYAALYEDGQLVTSGKTYNVHERLISMVCTSHDRSNDFMPTGNRFEVASTYDQVLANREVRLTKEKEAAELQARAADLMRQAEELLKQGH